MSDSEPAPPRRGIVGPSRSASGGVMYAWVLSTLYGEASAIKSGPLGKPTAIASLAGIDATSLA